MQEKEIVISRAEISGRIKELAKEISSDYRNCNLIVVGVLKGAFVFLADLLREIDIPLEVDFVRLASYGADTVSSGEVRLSNDIELEIVGKDVLIVEDIVDTGLSLVFLRKLFAGRNAKSIRICTLIDKKERRQVELEIDYTGFEIENGFLVGYGLDFAEQHRHLPDVYRLKNQT